MRPQFIDTVASHHLHNYSLLPLNCNLAVSKYLHRVEVLKRSKIHTTDQKGLDVTSYGINLPAIKELDKVCREMEWTGKQQLFAR